MDVAQFLQTVITTDKGYFCLAVRIDNEWMEHWYKWPEDLEEIVRHAEESSPEGDVYFSSYLFSQPCSKKEFVLPTKTIQADLDEADTNKIPIEPTILVKSSAGRHQAYWVLQDGVDLETHESLSKRLTYSIERCDHSGWALGRKVRLPGTLNHKYNSVQAVEVVGSSRRITSEDELSLLPAVDENRSKLDESWIDSPKPRPIKGPQEILASVKGQIPVKVYNQYSTRAKDRSAAMWALYRALFRAGLDRDTIFFVAKNSENNKFDDLKHGGDRELAKDILRAEVAETVGLDDIKAVILDIRKGQAMGLEKRQTILDLILGNMITRGKFIRTMDENIWYIKEELGRPILISTRSDYLNMILYLDYGINRADPEAAYVVNGLSAYSYGINNYGTTAALSYYDRISNIVYLHTGKKDVIKVTPDTLSVQVNGTGGLVFPWIPNSEQITLSTPLEEPWYETMFGDCFDNCIDLSREEGITLLRVWLLFLFFRDAAISRPILTLLGQPGCLSGKTILDIRRGDHSARSFTLEEIYRRYNSTWDKTIPTRILSLKDGVIQWKEIRNVVYSGKKQTFRIQVEGCKPIYATGDHRFLTSSGYKRLSELSEGDELIVKGYNQGSTGRNPTTRRIITARYHPHARQKMVGKYGPYYSVLYCRVVLEADLNGMSVDEFLGTLNQSPELSKTLTFLPKDIHIHHLDENPGNDSLENLQAMTKDAHDKLHGKNNVKSFGHYSGRWKSKKAKVISISPHKLEDTYDIEMVDDPNFLVNNVVVHNSGKSTLFRRIYALLYGRNRSIGALTSMEDFDHATASDPLTVFDNVDTWERWLPDRLALSASSSDITKRKLYTDMDTVVLKRQALVGITAHSPTFGREDVADRMLIVTFERLKHFKSEGEIIENILRKRNTLWSSVIKDIQKVLNTEVPDEVPQFRIEDFSRMGSRIACAVGCHSTFCKVIGKMRSAQRTFSLDEDQMLVTVVQRLASKDNSNQWKTPAQIWTEAELLSPDRDGLIKKYKNSNILGKKLWSLMENLQEIVKIEWKLDSNRGTKLWRITNG